MYKPVLLLALLSNVLLAAVSGITLQVSSETAPPGGYAQFKISLTSPTLVSSGSVTMNFDPTIFGPATGLAAFSATGDQTGAATLQGQQVVATLTSSSGGFGQLPDLPILVVTVPILATAKIGATSSITATSTIGAVDPGTFTVGGSLSIQNVTPGGGLLPAATVVAINGTGFDATTTVTIDGVNVATQLVSAQQINLTLNGATEMTGKHVHVANAVGAQTDYFASLPGVVTSPYALGNPGIFILPSLPSPPYTAVQWNTDPEAPVWFECLQNSNAFPVTAIFYWVTSTGVTTTQTVVIPPYGQYIAPSIIEGIGSYYMTVSAPIQMAQVYDSNRGPFELQSVRVSPATQMTSLGQLGVGQSGSLSRVWNWQVGTPAPAPQTAATFSAFPLTVSVSAGADAWLKVTTTNGSPASYTFTMTPVVTGLAVGTYTGTVTLTPQLPPDLAQFAPASVSIAVSITVTAQPQLLSDGGSTVPFSTALGSAPSTQTYPVTSNGNPAAFNVILPPIAASWLSVSPHSGTTPATLTLAANPAGLTAGSYQSSFVIQGPINTLNVAVTLTISSPGPGSLVVSPASLTFSLTPGQAAPSQPQFIAVHTPTPPVTVSASTQSGSGWLIAAVAGGVGVDVNATAVNLGPGTYTGTVTITSPLNLVATVPVTLIVAGPPGPAQLAVAPAGITLTAPVGTTATANLSVTAVSGPLVFTIASSSPPTLTLQIFSLLPQANSSLPAEIQLLVSAALPGTYQGSITISWNGGSATVPVTLYATPSPATPPVMSYLVNSGSAIPGSISPGEFITIFGSGLGGQPASLQLNSDLTAKTTLGGTQVLINAVPAPMVFTSTGQLNAIVPYEVGTSGAASVQVVSQGILSSAWAVPVVPAAPSILTSGGAGVGQGAIVNQDHSLNYETNPAARGTVIEIYTTGGGQTSPLSSTGSVARVAASLTLPVSVTIGGVNAQVLYAGNAPGEIEGVVQINVMVPPTAMPGTLPVVVAIGGVVSPPGVTVSVQ